MTPRLFDRGGYGADYEQLVVVQDARSGLRAIVAIHSTRLGPAFGGIRRLPYASEEAALDDVLKLAAGMTAKCALADLPAGGGKTVILDRPGLDAAAAYRALGEAVEELGGRYVCGPDVGTSDEMLDHVRGATDHVNPKGNESGPSTARGVLAGIRGTLTALDGGPGFGGRRFVVQGLGSVGLAVARRLLEGGGRVAGFDVSPEARERAAALGVEVLPADEVLRTGCDVLVPCALGGVLTLEVAAKVPARAVCGSANNQLAAPDAGRVLADRGVLYAPDFIVNAGAVIEGVFTVRDGATDEAREGARAHIDGIEQTVARVLREARERGVPPHDLALAEAEAKTRG